MAIEKQFGAALRVPESDAAGKSRRFLPLNTFLVVLLGTIGNIPIGHAAIHSGVSQIFSGSSGEFTCALLADGKLTCWGSNNGEAPANFDFQEYPKPRSASILDVSTGYGFACQLRADSSVWCWGNNKYGQLGTSLPPGTYPTPTQVKIDAFTPLDAKAISAGSIHACAIRNDETVWCWGGNSLGQLGDYRDSTTYVTASPQQVFVNVSGPRILTPIQTIAAGGLYTCALFDPDSNGSTGTCWGSNRNGELGTGIFTSYEPSPVTIFAGSVALHMTPYSIGAGTFHTCAMIPNGTLGCWGDNSRGANATRVSGSSPSPSTVYNGSVPLTTAAEISVGGSFTCALLNDATAACWGANTYGQIGHYRLSRADAFAPYPVLNADGSTMSSIQRIVTGNSHACTLTTDHKVRCWGNNARAQLGQDMFVANTDYPTEVPLDAPIFTDNFQSD